MNQQPGNLTLLGTGLIGGSVGLAARKLGWHVTACDLDAETARQAVRIGAADTVADEPAEAVREADLVIVAVPVGGVVDLFAQIRDALPTGAVVTDVVSTKRTICQAAAEGLHDPSHFVGAHPMAGREKSGIKAAVNDLFAHRPCLLTPTDQTAETAVVRVEKFWQSLGCVTSHVTPEEHDRLVALISHLPHVTAVSLVNTLPDGVSRYAGGGLRDTTRVAAGSPRLWREILLDNRENVLQGLDELVRAITDLRQAIERKDVTALEQLLSAAADKRQAMNGPEAGS